jgi:putative ABC transport system permease protein
MLFIIMTISIAIYSASAARTINRNEIDRVMFDVGADIVVHERFQFIDPNPEYILERPMDPTSWTLVIRPNQELFFTELPFEIYTNPEGVEIATKVYRNERASLRIPGGVRASNIQVMAIYPDEFAQVAFWRDDMFDYHFNYLMNAMSVNQNHILVSRNLMERLDWSHGDEIVVSWQTVLGETSVNCIIYDAIDAFPNWNPINEDGRATALVVMSYELVRSKFNVEPYEVWISVNGLTSNQDIITSIFESRDTAIMRGHFIDEKQPMFAFYSLERRIDDVRNDPFITAMNGFLSLNFALTLALMIIGFLVFWIFEMRSRRLQISIMRSSGVSQFSIIIMLMWEQVFLTILPLIAGFVLGNIGASLFVPLFELSGHQSPLAFRIFMQTSDSIRVGIIVSGSILLAMIMIWFIAARIKISQTLKLGEE